MDEKPKNIDNKMSVQQQRENNVVVQRRRIHLVDEKCQRCAGVFIGNKHEGHVHF